MGDRIHAAARGVTQMPSLRQYDAASGIAALIRAVARQLAIQSQLLTQVEDSGRDRQAYR